jgi:hypothetical protein
VARAAAKKSPRRAGYRSASGRSRKAPLGEPGTVVVVVATGAVVVVVAAGAVVVVVPAGAVVVVVAAGAVVEVVVAAGAVDVVVAGGAAVVVVVLPGGGHVPLAPHASQQLDTDPTHAVPPCGALQALSPCLTVQLVWPWALVRQQVTKPRLPQVDTAAQCTTAPLHSGGSDPSFTAASTTRATQFTYLP